MYSIFARLLSLLLLSGISRSFKQPTATTHSPSTMSSSARMDIGQSHGECLSSCACPTTKILPKNLVIGYCNWNQCDDGIIKAVENGTLLHVFRTHISSCICIYKLMRTYAYACIHTHTHIYIYIYMDTYMHTYICSFINT